MGQAGLKSQTVKKQAEIIEDRKFDAFIKVEAPMVQECGDASLQPKAAIHFETAMRQGLLHSQIGRWPRRSAPVSVVTGPDLTQQSS